ncbi:type II toxin-antitoxin system ParD family antitoxin [Sphingomonas sp.]|jgi:antitoxin ParD1/3/4|uniref:type II toxin-antitoxin system ParD family antitoxin n=1 Tax=Sphingomonas sp. TaxID=28214 RepID=UPI002D7FDA96|nr:type II toxin-antitoxin system ParD family antitoxin [Sphingomonas sp.]HEU0045320.1 type II toxin-antitoxin system ParD family antitoxin [Sphingomonas sp.]
MAQVNVSLPDDLSDWARLQATEGRFVDASDYVRDVVRRDREHGEQRARLQAAIDDGRASPISERTIEDIIADGRRRHAGR